MALTDLLHRPRVASAGAGAPPAPEPPAPRPQGLWELDARTRRREAWRATAATTLTWVLLLGAYYLWPLENLHGGGAFARLGAGLVVFMIVLAWQARRIARARLPGVRAAVALGGMVALFLVVFSSTYLSMAHSSEASFSRPLDHTSALYFTITVLATVGFGDIVPRTDAGRVVVSIQMLLDLFLIGFAVHLIVNVAKARLLARQGGSAAPSPGGTAALAAPAPAPAPSSPGAAGDAGEGIGP